MMEQANQGSCSSTRKRGRPSLGDEGCFEADENLIGQVFSGVVEGCFEAGYFLNVKVLDTEKQFKGIVFLPNKVAPLTPATDLFPQANMYLREEAPASSNQQTPPEVKKNQSAMLPDERNHHHHPMDTEPEGQTLSLMPQFASDDIPKEDHTVLRPEATPKQQGNENEKSPEDAEPPGVEVKSASPVDDDDVPEELQLELGNKKMNASSAVVTEANPDQPGSSKSGFV